jgi:hypothetical protein
MMPTAVVSRVLIGGSLIVVVLLAMIGPRPAFVRAADPPANAARAKDAKAERDRERLQWEARIVFFGEEDTGTWSLRVQDKTVRERNVLQYTELWKFDPGAKKWVKVDDGAEAVRILPPAEKPETAPQDTQLIAELPIQPNTVGLYYAKWRVNNRTDGATLCRIGPGLTGKDARPATDRAPQKVPPGMIPEVVPLSINKAELMVIPDPRLSTGQAMKGEPTSRPAGEGKN